MTKSSLGQNRHAGIPLASAYTPVRITDSCFQWHRALAHLGFLQPSGKLFTDDSHRATNMRVMAPSVSPAFARSRPEEREFPSASSLPWDNRKDEKLVPDVENREKIPATCASGPC